MNKKRALSLVFQAILNEKQKKKKGKKKKKIGQFHLHLMFPCMTTSIVHSQNKFENVMRNLKHIKVLQIPWIGSTKKFQLSL